MVEYITKSDAVFAACLVLTKFGGCSMGPFCPDSGCREVREVFKDVPAADVVEVRHGRWMKDCDRVMGDGWTYTQRHCSECGGQTVECVNYCQFCGAKMDGGQDDV